MGKSSDAGGYTFGRKSCKHLGQISRISTPAKVRRYSNLIVCHVDIGQEARTAVDKLCESAEHIY